MSKRRTTVFDPITVCRHCGLPWKQHGGKVGECPTGQASVDAMYQAACDPVDGPYFARMCGSPPPERGEPR